MAGIVTNLLGGGLLGGISTLINTIRGKSPEDAAKLADLAAKYRSELAEADKEMQLAQIQVNSVEAASSDKYTSQMATDDWLRLWGRSQSILSLVRLLHGWGTFWASQLTSLLLTWLR
jgi:hypothetical protein